MKIRQISQKYKILKNRGFTYTHLATRVCLEVLATIESNQIKKTEELLCHDEERFQLSSQSFFGISARLASLHDESAGAALEFFF